jgi:membrane associated rhomboid family serine protease
VQVAGASGGVFGLFGLFVAYLLLNTESVKRPVLRSLGILCFLAYFLYNVFSQVRR